MIYDVLIVGTGVAGLYTALNIRDDLSVLVITKGKRTDCNSYLAQGGISTALNTEDISIFINDTLKAGNYKNNIDSVKEIAEKSMDITLDLINLGVPFDKNYNTLNYTREGGHSVNRILHVKDQTGKAIVDSLLDKVSLKKNIKILENTTLENLIIFNNVCIGGLVSNEENEYKIFSKITVLATGGIGGIFNSTTNVESLTGDGIKVALHNKINVVDMEYQQLHPTVLYKKETNSRRLLLTESLRGEGAIIINQKGDKFIDPLLPRDIVSASILNEISKNYVTPYVYLDVRSLGKEYLKKRFPYIYNECLKIGLEIHKDLIPISPAHHFSMGGIKVNLNGQTSLNNLYAVGEVSCTGVHGSNRLASNSLLEAIVFAKNAAEDINIKAPELCISTNFQNNVKRINEKILIEYLKKRVDYKYAKLFNS
ncbi:L-aspartate oxidase [Clostridium sp.]|uniref:L-aspartate oxidase n=1 Tax=Clostridium sp. TaxID=1506 RepID=UPI00342FDFAC